MQKIIKFIKQKPALLCLVVWFGIAWSWSLTTDSLDLVGSKKQGLALAVFVVVINATISSTVIWQTIRLVKYVHKNYSTRWLLLIGLPLFALADFLVCWLTTIIWIGPQGQADNVLPMGSLALPLINTPFKFASRFVGFYGLAAFLWFFIFLFSQKKTRKFAIYPIILLTLTSLLGWGLYRAPNDHPLRVKLVSETLRQRVPPIDPKGVDLVVFPEYGLEKNDNKNLYQRIARTTGDQPKTYFLGSEQLYKKDITGHINNMEFGNTADGITNKEYKYRLIPGGEDLPYVARIILRATGQKDTLDYFSNIKGVVKGSRQLRPFKLNGQTRVAAAVCSSIIAPQDYRAFTSSGATVFTNSASLTTFKGSPLFAYQQKSLARFMAVANARYFLQSANAASAYALDANGKQIVEVRGITTVDVVAQNNTSKTFYTYVGEWLVGAGFLSGLGLVITYWKNNRSEDSRI